MAERKKDWVLTENALRQLLDWLDEGVDSGGEKYLEMRRRLVAYFDRKGSRLPEELADETLNRVARRLQEEGEIDTPPARYCYITAKFVFLEHLRLPEHTQTPAEIRTGSALSPVRHASLSDEEERAIREQRLECLDRCLQQLDPDTRDLVSQYYFGEQRVKIDNRRGLAARLGLTMNALSIRVCRIRDKLESCVRKCAAHA